MDDLTTAPTDLLAKHIATTRCIVYTRRLKNTERLARPFPVFLSFLHAHADVFESLFAPWTYDSHKPPNSKSPLYAIFRDEWLPLACAKLAAYMDEHPIPAEMSAALWDALYDVCKTKRTQLSTGQPGPRALKGWEPNEMPIAHMADSETSTPPPMDMYEQMRARKDDLWRRAPTNQLTVKRGRPHKRVRGPGYGRLYRRQYRRRRRRVSARGRKCERGRAHQRSK